MPPGQRSRFAGWSEQDRARARLDRLNAAECDHLPPPGEEPRPADHYLVGNVRPVLVADVIEAAEFGSPRVDDANAGRGGKTAPDLCAVPQRGASTATIP